METPERNRRTLYAEAMQCFLNRLKQTDIKKFRRIYDDETNEPLDGFFWEYADDIIAKLEYESLLQELKNASADDIKVYVQSAVYSKKYPIGEKTLRKNLPKQIAENLKISERQKASWSVLALYVGYFGWQGYIDELTIEQGFELVKAKQIARHKRNERLNNSDNEPKALKDGDEIQVNTPELKQLDDSNRRKNYLVCIERKSGLDLVWERIKFRFFKKWHSDSLTVLCEPLAIDRFDLDDQLRSYISNDYQFLPNYDKDADRQPNVVNHLVERIYLERDLAQNRAKYYFILAGSGIGKTTMLASLVSHSVRVRSKKRGSYILPFSQWRDCSMVSNEKAKGCVLLLDAMDEDFSLSNSESISKISSEFKKITSKFDNIIITSRSQFFHSAEVINLFGKSVAGEKSRAFEIISLCPFSELQVEEYVKFRFPSRTDRIKAAEVIDLMGKDVFQRQLLISKIHLFYHEVYKRRDQIEERTKGYQLFQLMLTEWIQDEKNKLSSSKLSTYLDGVDEFCKGLAKAFVKSGKRLHNGLSFNEIVRHSTEHGIDKPKVKIKRSYLKKDKHERFRFAHKSVLEFYCIEVALADWEFRSSEYLNSFIEGDFFDELFNQGVLVKLREAKSLLAKEGLVLDVQLTQNESDVQEYKSQMLYEPFFELSGANIKPYIKDKEWIPIRNFDESTDSVDSVIGIKLLCTEGNEQWLNEDQEMRSARLVSRKRCFQILRNLYHLFPNLYCIDLSELGLTDEHMNFMDFRNIQTLNLRGNKLKHITDVVSHPNAHVNLRENPVRLTSGSYDFLVQDLSTEVLDSLISSELVVSSKLALYVSQGGIKLSGDVIKLIRTIQAKNKLEATDISFFNEYETFIVNEKIETQSLEAFYRLDYYSSFSDRRISIRKVGDNQFDKFYRFKNSDLLSDHQELLELEINSFNPDPRKFTFTKEELKLIGESIFSVQLFVGDISLLHRITDVTIHAKGLVLDWENFSRSQVGSSTTAANFYFFNGLKSCLENFEFVRMKSLGDQAFLKYLNPKKIRALHLPLLKIPKFKMSLIEDWQNLESLALQPFLKECEIDLANIDMFPSLNEVIILANNNCSTILHLEKVFDIPRLRLVELNIYSNEPTNGSAPIFKSSNSIEKLVLSEDLFNSFTKESSVFPNLSSFVVRDYDRNKKRKESKCTEVSFEFLDRLEKLRILRIYKAYTFKNVEKLQQSKISELSFTLKFPSTSKEVSEVIETLKAISSDVMDKLEVMLVANTTSKDTYHTTYKILNLLFDLSKQMEVRLDISQYEPRSILSKYAFRISIDFGKVLSGKCQFNQVDVMNGISFETGTLYAEIFDSVTRYFVEEIGTKEFGIDEFLLPMTYLKNRTLNFTTSLFESYQGENEHKYSFYFNSLVPTHTRHLIPYKHIRMIGVPIPKNIQSPHPTGHKLNTSFSYLLSFVQTLSLSEVQDVPFESFRIGLPDLKTIELLSYYMTEAERETIEQSAKAIKKIGFEVIVNPNEIITNQSNNILEIHTL